jgi:hypothetical protein
MKSTISDCAAAVVVLVLASLDAAVTGLSGLQDGMAASLNSRQLGQHFGRIEEASEEQSQGISTWKQLGAPPW